VFEPEFCCVLMDGKRYLGLTNNLNWLAWSSWILRYYSNRDLIIDCILLGTEGLDLSSRRCQAGWRASPPTPFKACSRIRPHFLGLEAHDLNNCTLCLSGVAANNPACTSELVCEHGGDCAEFLSQDVQTSPDVPLLP